MNLVCLFFIYLFIFVLNSRWPPKVAGKRFLQNVANILCRYPAGRRKRSVSFRFRDKCIFVFNTEIQDGRQKWRESIFLQNNASRLCKYPVGQKFCQNRAPFPR